MRRDALLLVCACALAAGAPLLQEKAAVAVAPGFPGWPAHFEGKPITALPLTPIEQQFQAQFPGRVGRFTDGRREIILRWVAEPTRRLHPAGDCFKANGYALAPLPLLADGAVRWSGFSAARDGVTYQVRERIYDMQGGQWSDVSSWYWAAQLNRTGGPWWAVTVATR